jgi:ABC-2 type transport system permease protein
MKMYKIWQIIKYEYRRHVFNKRFLFSLLSLPIVVIAMTLAAFAIAFFFVDTSPVGYVDFSRVLSDPIPLDIEGDIFNPAFEFIPYTDEAQAQQDLESGQIQAYYVIPEGFPDIRDIQLFFTDMPDSTLQNQFRLLILQNLDTFQNLDPLVKTRLQEGSLFTMATVDESREMREDQWFLIIMPIIISIIFILTVMTSGGYLLQAVVEEKENRTMEIVITSVTPSQLMTGKTIGNISVGLTQLVVWLIFVWVGLMIGARFWPFLSEISIPGQIVVVMLLIFLPAFVMVAAIMSTIGAIMTEMSEAQQISGLFSLLITIPFYVTTTIMSNPNGPLAIILSFFPLSAPITIMMRMAFTNIPTWQITLNVLVLVVLAAFSVWLAGRAFRLGMLQYGKKVSLKDLFRKLEPA